jgi:hypothetical protein
MPRKTHLKTYAWSALLLVALLLLAAYFFRLPRRDLTIVKHQTPVDYFFLDSALVHDDCSATKAVSRMLFPNNVNVDFILRDLLAGVSESEKQNGVESAFVQNTGENLQQYFEKAEIKDGVAIVYFERGALRYLNAPACMQQMVKGPIVQTLKHNFHVERVEFAIDGKIYTDWDA